MLAVNLKLRIRLATLAMSCFITLSVTSWLSAVQLASDNVQFPYQAIVLKDDASVRSGPGQVHYATDELKQGATVEVYRHDPGGWCAIRPTKGSFSLVPAEAIELIDEGVGEISDAGTQAWVGTRLGAVERPLWQVKLREKETVEVLGEVSWPHPDGHSTIWYQIAPPAGEFRWIQISDLQLPPTQSLPVAKKTAAPKNDRNNSVRSMLAAPSKAAWPGTFSPAQSTTPTASVEPPQDERIDLAVQPTSLQRIKQKPNPVKANNLAGNMNLGWRRSTRPIPDSIDDADRFASRSEPPAGVRVASVHPQAGFVEQSRASKQNARGSVANATYNSSTNQDRFARVATRPDVAPDNWADRLQSPSTASLAGSDRVQDLELQLTNEMVKHPSQWQVGNIVTAAELIHDSTTFPDERLRAARVIEKCRKCKTVQAGFENVYRNQGDSMVGTTSNARRPAAVGSGVKGFGDVDQEVSFGTTYDAFGWLNELVRQQGSLDSAYVLQNRDGKITHHITPAPGVNLHRYVKSKVGIIGQRGYNHNLNLDHVTADRVIVLEKAK